MGKVRRRVIRKCNGFTKPQSCCTICGKNICNLRRHIKEIHVQAKVNCSVCNKRFNPRYIETHMKVHLEDKKRVACPYCSSEFIRKSVLRSHLQKYHNRNDTNDNDGNNSDRTIQSDDATNNENVQQMKTFVCIYCPNFYMSKFALNRHIANSNPEFAAKCDACGKSYIQSHYCAILINCDLCGLSFRNMTLLREHKLSVHVHNAEAITSAEVTAEGTTEVAAEVATEVTTKVTTQESIIKNDPKVQVQDSTFENETNIQDNGTFENPANQSNDFSMITSESPEVNQSITDMGSMDIDVQNISMIPSDNSALNQSNMDNGLMDVDIQNIPIDFGYLCMLCCKTFSNLNELQQHELNHLPYSCEKCGEVLRTIHNLNKHLPCQE